MKKSKKILVLILGIIIVILSLTVAWLAGKQTATQSVSKTVKTGEIRSKKAEKKSESRTNEDQSSSSEQESSEDNVNEAFGCQLNSNDFLVLAYCKKWEYSLDQFLDTANQDSSACLNQYSDLDDFHGVSIDQGTGDSICELTSIDNNSVTISGGNPVSDSDFHNIVYSKKELTNQFIHSESDVKTLQELTNKLISNQQENDENTENDSNEEVDNEAHQENESPAKHLFKKALMQE